MSASQESQVEKKSCGGGLGKPSEEYILVDESTQKSLNAQYMVCTCCQKTIILSPKMSSLIEIQLDIHKDAKKKGEAPELESLTWFWEVANIMKFDNVCVSKGVQGANLKYLTCAECERGIFGVHYLPTHEKYAGRIFVAHSRVTCMKEAPKQEIAPSLLSFARQFAAQQQQQQQIKIEEEKEKIEKKS